MKTLKALSALLFVVFAFAFVSCEDSSIYSGSQRWAWGDYTGFEQVADNPGTIQIGLYGKVVSLDGSDFTIFKGLPQGEPYDPATGDEHEAGKKEAQNYLRVDVVSKDSSTFVWVKRKSVKTKTLKKPVIVTIKDTDLLYYKLKKEIDEYDGSTIYTLYTAEDIGFKTNKRVYELLKN